ncbi:hypothetical protein [Pseudomonas bananamidigenes]|uniref:hypothetical protein n=1 Tax=Pseudomonas bananamidigenes TaxID=2843610 RepID=UPI00080348B2|nr:hypothetical protein [Pseudomonas bananamidigenes]
MKKHPSLLSSAPFNLWTISYGLGLTLSVLITISLFFANNATESTQLPPQTNNTSVLKGNFEQCKIGSFWITVSGWAYLEPAESTIKIHLFATGNKGVIQLLTRRIYRKDVSNFLKIKSALNLHGFYASAIGYKLRKRYGTSVQLYIEDSKGVMHYGGAYVCTKQ